MGNEERESATEAGLRILTSMKKVATQQDGSLPRDPSPRLPLVLISDMAGSWCRDGPGYNYADPQIEAFHKAQSYRPSRYWGLKNVSAVSTRGIYTLDAEKGFVGWYDPYTTTGRASAEGWWRFVAARQWMPGGFVWTGFDYRGEPSPYQWPNISSQYGGD